MTDHDFELRLRADLGKLAEPAPAMLRARVVAIPDEVPASVGRRLIPETIPAMLRFASLTAAAAVILAMVLVGIGQLVRPPDVDPPPASASPSVQPSAVETERVYGWPTTRRNGPGLFSWDGSSCGLPGSSSSCSQSLGGGFMHNGYGSGNVEIVLEAGGHGDIAAAEGTRVPVAGHDGIYRRLDAEREQWLVEIQGTTLSIVLSAEPGTGQADLAEAHAIIDSMRTEARDNDIGFRLVFRLTTEDWDSG